LLGRGLDRSLVLLAGLAFAAQLIVGTMLPILPLFALELGATPVMLGLMVSISAVASAGGQFLGGAVSDRMGARRLLPAGFVGYGAASALTAVATSAPVVVALRGLSGLGSGVYLIGERLYIREVVDRARLAFANSLVQAAAAVGLIVGPLLGGVVADASDLRAPFVIATAASAAIAVIALFLPSRRHANAATEPSLAAPIRTSRASLGVLTLANFALAAGYGSFITTFAPFATEGLNWTTSEIGLAFSIFALGNVVGAPMLGAAADHFGRRHVGALATIPIVVFAVALVIPAPDAPLYLLALAAGIGVAGFNASWYALLGIATGGPKGGRAFGAVTAVASLGIIVGALAAGQLWESIDIRAGMIVTVVAMAVAGLSLAAYPEATRDAEPASERQGT
jgi:MFS family permease